MKKIGTAIIGIFVILLTLQAASAFAVKNPTFPSSNIQAGQQISGQLIIEFPSSGGLTFPMEDDLALFTDLTNPKWSAQIEVDGVTNPPMNLGRYPKIDGFYLSYPSKNTVKVIVGLEGQVPVDGVRPEISIVKIQQVDSSGTPRTTAGSQYFLNTTIIDTGDISTRVSRTESDLAGLSSTLDAQSALGVDVSAAKTKFNEAKAALDRAKSEIGSKNYQAATSSLNSAADLITQAGQELEKAMAKHDLDRAGQKVNEVGSLIDYFKTNRSMGSDARVVEIVSKYETASQLLSTARANFDRGEYSSARIGANQTSQKADEAYNLATSLRAEIGEGFSLGGMLPIVLGVVVVGVLIAVGYAVYRKKTKWDELG
ncbi:MAG: hypothetical protein QMD46_00100 [Methanomicrobiales archaeon]|nr:hypothetical protein [Methanomicrobiales archaeon]MDI6875826.1 hypothetical protein [Methanomicrobiales archaeon]